MLVYPRDRPVKINYGLPLLLRVKRVQQTVQRFWSLGFNIFFRTWIYKTLKCSNAHTHTHKHTHAHIQVCTHTHTHTQACIHAHTFYLNLQMRGLVVAFKKHHNLAIWLETLSQCWFVCMLVKEKDQMKNQFFFFTNETFCNIQQKHTHINKKNPYRDKHTQRDFTTHTDTQTHICKHTCLHTHVLHTHTHTEIYAHTHTHTHTQTHRETHTDTQTHRYTQTQIHLTRHNTD